MYKRILVAVDGSRTSCDALRAALELAGDSGVQLRIVHVIGFPYDYPDAMYGHVAGDLDDLRQTWRTVGQEIIDQALTVARQTRPNPEAALLESEGRCVSATIVADAGRWAADLLVVGTHGRRGLDRLLLGSVAEEVSRTAGMSVLLVRAARSEHQT